MSIDALCLYPQVRYIAKKITNGKINKVFQPNKYDIYIYIRNNGENNILFISLNPQRPMVTLTKDLPDNPPEPPSFCMLLRKQIENGKIAKVMQYHLDRIIIIDIDGISSNGTLITKSLIIELVGNYANLILMQDGTIIDSLRRIGENNNRVRCVLPGYDYILPPSSEKINIFSENIEEVKERIKNYDDTIYFALLNTLEGFGPISIQEVLYRANINKDKKTLEMGQEEFDDIYNVLVNIKSQISNDEINPTMVINQKGKIKIMAPFFLSYCHNEEKKYFKNTNEMLEAFKKLNNVTKMPHQQEYEKIVKNEENRLNKKIKILQYELEDAKKSELYKIKADTLMTYSYTNIDINKQNVKLPNIYNEDEILDIRLDPRYSIMDNIQIYYKKYEKLKRSQKMIENQIEIAKNELLYANSLSQNLEHCDNIIDLMGIKEELIKSKYIKDNKKKQMSIGKSKPYSYILPNKMEILVGKNNIQNDNLSFKIGSKNDIWLHTKDIPGSHVLILTRGEDIDDYNLGLAAQIAIFYSKGRDSTNVRVDYTYCKFLKKPKGAKPGYVAFSQNKTIFATVNEEEIFPIMKRGEEIGEKK